MKRKFTRKLAAAATGTRKPGNVKFPKIGSKSQSYAGGKSRAEYAKATKKIFGAGAKSKFSNDEGM